MSKKILAPLLVFCCLLPASGAAAEFDLDAGRIILRRLQYCRHCGSALLVTGVHPGVMVRCPDCGREQPRLDNRFLLTQVYQICRLCMAPLDARGRHPGDIVECATCHTRQALVRDAFAADADPGAQGQGYAPGFPPGSGRKNLVYSPEFPDAPITPVPLPDPFFDLPLPDPAVTVTPIPKPPAVRDEPPAVADPEPPLPELAPRVQEVPTDVADTARHDDNTITVPAVTVDLFGGKKPPEAVLGGGYIGSGRVLARVDGEPIHESEVARITEPVMRQLRERAAGADAEALAEQEKILRREVLERLVDRQLAVREALLSGHRADPSALRQREQELASILAGTGVDIRREAERDVIMADMRRRFTNRPGAVSPEAAREFYRKNREHMMRPRQMAMDQLVIYEDRTGRSDAREYRDIALEVSRALEAGERFDPLRERYDEFLPSAGITPTPPVLQPESAYAAEILAAAGDLRKGAVFGPLFLEGIVVFGKVADVRPEGPVPFEEVEKDIRRRLESEAVEKDLDDWLKRLRQKSRIEYLVEG